MTQIWAKKTVFVQTLFITLWYIRSRGNLPEFDLDGVPQFVHYLIMSDKCGFHVGMIYQYFRFGKAIGAFSALSIDKGKRI